MATEEIAHTVLKQDGDIEIRQYEDTVVAEVTVQATRREAPGRAFRALFNYISGENEGAREIPMTTPVSQAAEGTEIPMTAPVSQRQSGENRWTIAFYMPNDMAYEETPAPENEAITVRAVPGRTMAAIRFSGIASDANVAEHEEQLRDYLQTHDIPFTDEPLYAFYNSPMMPWFLRRNEVLFPVEWSSQ